MSICAITMAFNWNRGVSITSDEKNDLMLNLLNKSQYLTGQEPLVKSAQALGAGVKEQLGQPLSNSFERVRQSIPELTYGVFEGMSRIAGEQYQRYIAGNPIEPIKPNETVAEYAQRHPMLWEAMTEHAKTLPIAGSIPLLPILYGLTGEVLLPGGGEKKAEMKGAEFLAKESKLSKFVPLGDEANILRGVKGMTAENIMAKHPDIKLIRDVPATDIHGNKVKIPENEVLTPYELKGNKILLQDGETYIVSKNQFQNIKCNAISKEAKPFAQELAEASKIGTGQWKKPPPNTKYQNYQLPGGENYKEILIKTPRHTDLSMSSAKAMNDYADILQKKYNIPDERAIAVYKNFVSPEEATKLNSLIEKNSSAKINTFKSSHWDEPNVISHLRMNERTYQGKKVAFMEELQSDWAREVRKQGIGLTFNVKTPELLKNWQEPTVKRALQEAVKDNADYFSWISGEQTSARY